MSGYFRYQVLVPTFFFRETQYIDVNDQRSRLTTRTPSRLQQANRLLIVIANEVLNVVTNKQYWIKGVLKIE